MQYFDLDELIESLFGKYDNGSTDEEWLVNHYFKKIENDGRVYFSYDKRFERDNADPIVVSIFLSKIEKHRFKDNKNIDCFSSHESGWHINFGLSRIGHAPKSESKAINFESLKIALMQVVNAYKRLENEE